LQDKEYITEDEIDLREVFKTIWESKNFIITFTFVVTSLSLIYVFFKNPIPIYQGKTYVEIGQIQSQNFGQISIDTTSDLAQILKLEFELDANVVKNTTNILEIISQNKDKNVIKQTLEKALETIINKHKEKAKIYENVIMTKQIGDIKIDEQAINKPKKTLIVVVSFVTGFILSIFLLFFIQFINSMRKEEK
jgi:LPS O-antigen subunit length determinant protein (WzzB/FepE family)